MGGVGTLAPDSEATSLRRGHGGRISRVVDRLMYGWRVNRYLNEHGQEYTHVVFSSIPLGAVRHILRAARRFNHVVIHDAVEWYSSDQFPFGRIDLRYVAKDLLNRRVIKPPIKIIAISSYLEKHFRNAGCDVVRIPAIVAPSDYSVEKEPGAGLTRIVYAGSPGRKDNIDRLVSGFLALTSDERARVRLTFLGVDMDDLARLCIGVSKSELRESGIRALGRVKRARVLKEMSHADFTVLLRDPSRRVSQAGFPTKVAESLATATPVICNESSDLYSYLEDGREAIRIREFSADAVTEALRVAAATDPLVRAGMQARARECAVSRLSPESCSDDLRALLNGSTGSVGLWEPAQFAATPDARLLDCRHDSE